jgi:muramidase (phage lysozyme)
MTSINNREKNLNAFLDMIGKSEGTSNSPATLRDGYDVIVTGIDGKSEIFSDFSDHPFADRKPKQINKSGLNSSASGKYQILIKFWPYYKRRLGLVDFSPQAQDKVAIQLIRECGALGDIEEGRIETAINKCSRIWASLPGNKYGQRAHKVPTLVAFYKESGGVLA